MINTRVYEAPCSNTPNSNPVLLFVALNAKRKTPKINEAYQKLCYNQGVLEFNGEHFDKAITNFDKSLTEPIDPELKKNALFWKAESAYALKRDDAAELYQAVLAKVANSM